MKTCQMKGCTHPAEFAVILELRAWPHHAPATTTPIVVVCAEHQDVKWTDVVGPEGFAQIQRNFAQMGKAAPVQKFSNVKIVPLPKEQ